MDGCMDAWMRGWMVGMSGTDLERDKGETGAHCSKGSVRKYRLSQSASTLPIVEVHRDYTEPGEFAQHVYNDVLTAVKRDFPLAAEVRARYEALGPLGCRHLTCTIATRHRS